MDSPGKRLGRAFLDFFLPHDRNDFRPHLFRIAGFTATLLLVFFVSAGVIAYQLSLRPSSYLASVLPGVLIDLANADRADNALASLTVDPKLVAAAQLKANDMAAKGYFAHVSPDGTTPWYWFAQAGYSFVYAGENLAVDFDDSAAVNQAWMNSPTHRANILGAHYTQIGIAAAQGTYQGRLTTFVVEEFASPAGDAASATNAPLSVNAPTPTPVASSAATTTDTTTPSTEQPVQPVAASEPKVEGAPRVSAAETFISVKSSTVAPATSSAPAAGSASEPALPSQGEVPAASALSAQVLTSSSKILGLLYLIIAVLLGAVGVGVLVVEHPRRGRHLIQLGVLFLALFALYEMAKLLSPVVIG